MNFDGTVNYMGEMKTERNTNLIKDYVIIV